MARQGRDSGGARRVSAEHRVEGSAAKRRERDSHGLVLGSSGKAEQPLIPVLAQIDDCVLPDRDVTEPTSR
jgi:hypothetical protein